MMWQMLVPLIGQVIDKVVPDSTSAAEAKVKLAELAGKGELAELEATAKMLQNQADINKIDAGSQDWFQRRWRSGAGWICVAGFALHFVVFPLTLWVATLMGRVLPPPPAMDADALMTLLFGLLGLGGLRTWERLRGKA